MCILSIFVYFVYIYTCIYIYIYIHAYICKYIFLSYGLTLWHSHLEVIMFQQECSERSIKSREQPMKGSSRKYSKKESVSPIT